MRTTPPSSVQTQSSQIQDDSLKDVTQEKVMQEENSLRALVRGGVVWQAERSEKVSESKFLSMDPYEALQASSSRIQNFEIVSCGVPEIDACLPAGGIQCGALHEYFPTKKQIKNSKQKESPPLSILSCIATQALFKKLGPLHMLKDSKPNNFIIWVGKESWPAPPFLKKLLQYQDISLMPHCLFIDPPDPKRFLWSLELALRSSSAVAVIANCKNLRTVTSRRLELACKKSGALGLLIRSAQDISRPAFAATRWSVSPSPSNSLFPNFELELLKCRGQQPETRRWIIELTQHEEYEYRTNRNEFLPQDSFAKSGNNTCAALSREQLIQESAPSPQVSLRISSVLGQRSPTQESGATAGERKTLVG